MALEGLSARSSLGGFSARSSAGLQAELTALDFDELWTGGLVGEEADSSCSSSEDDVEERPETSEERGDTREGSPPLEEEDGLPTFRSPSCPERSDLGHLQSNSPVLSSRAIPSQADNPLEPLPGETKLQALMRARRELVDPQKVSGRGVLF
eukprot:TRINITY_DN101005_c0_g1_i1.p1 TRINITY_DN101005_c0_g1~~TRINITY_DN101005_c0_g1_i1.p1  ORF type:complete len:152 (-),score=23.42 TRINITY_DN101005_c0_g1_i1:112-567(-)